jgi:hypothetical protein
MRPWSFLAALVVIPHHGLTGEFSNIVEGRINSREWAAVVSADLCRAFPERTREIVVAIGLEYPEGAMAAALAAAREIPERVEEAGEAAASLVQAELRGAAMNLVMKEAGR